LQHWDEIRLKARHWRRIVLERSGGDVSAEALLTAASSVTGVSCEGLPPEDSLLFGAHAVLRLGVVWFDRTRERWQQLFDQAHEYGHFWLGVEGCLCGAADLNWEASEDSVPIGISRVEGYGPHERRELEANVFARELLLPGNTLRQWFLEEGLNASRISKHVGMPEGLVWHQLSRALLSPELPDKLERSSDPSSEFVLDDKQKRAAYIDHGPILVDAGPGTGKTRTLTGRIGYLLTQPNVKPEQILALTYTNKAAEEMRSRVALIAPEKAQRIWMGTFHAFGLELLRKFYEKCGLTEKPKVIDELDAQLLLERSLGSLKLSHYRSLSEPTRYMRDILSAISRLC
jgi:DNA helicase-2/ATP-dependent DNA helicase PcrA